MPFPSNSSLSIYSPPHLNLHLPTQPMNQQQQQAPPKMSKKGQWEALFVDQDDSLSLSDLPSETLDDINQEELKSSEAIEEFEFRTLGGGSLLPKADMCAADQVFHKGQLLPLRLSSVGYSSSSSSSSGGLGTSSRSISRSQSSTSSHSSGCEVPPPRVSVSNIFYAYPSPRPQAGSRRTPSIGPARRSAGSAPPGWNVFTLGIAKAPEIELNDLRLRRLRASTSGGAKEIKKNVSSSSLGLGLGLGCKCRPDAVEPIPIKAPKKICKKERKEEGVVKLGLRREESMCRSRMIRWLEELSIGKGLVG